MRRLKKLRANFNQLVISIPAIISLIVCGISFKRKNQKCIYCNDWNNCPNLPFIFEGYKEDMELKRMTERDALLLKYGNAQVRVTSSNSYSEHEKVMTLNAYANQSANSFMANETVYLFGPIFSGPLLQITNKYKFPISNIEEDATTSFGFGGKHSGVSFHTHGSGYAEMIHGRKRWFFYPPGLNPFPEHTDISTAFWFSHHLPTLSQSAKPLFDCTLEPGQLLFFPNDWWHATLNLDHHNIFFSTFINFDTTNNNIDYEYFEDWGRKKAKQQSPSFFDFFDPTVVHNHNR
mmetsp:Transcript_9673/g.13428  ORF Transcript_9673/g.13428 Transcript_9673/m.13428 type:complete len:291 (-) Transcript_9673:85-957(-)